MEQSLTNPSNKNERKNDGLQRIAERELGRREKVGGGILQGSGERDE